LTIALALTLSASLADAGQRGQRWPDRSSGGGSSSGGSSSGQGSGGGQAAPRSAPAPAPSPRSGPSRAEAPPPPPPQQGGGQISRWGAPRDSQRSEPSRAEQAPPPPRPTSQPSRWGDRRDQTPTTTEAPRTTGSQIQRWGTRRDETPTTTPAPASAGVATQRWATPRAGDTPSALPPLVPAPASPEFASGSSGVSRSDASNNGQRVAQPRQRFPNPEDQRQASGVAVPRGSVQTIRPGSDNRTVILGRPTTRVYNNYYYYPRHSYPYGFGSYGLGYFYYDPYVWYDGYHYDYYPSYSYPGSYSNYGYYQYRYGYPTGELRLQVRPRHAEVYVDGYYAGQVDDFDGFLQSLRIEEGPHTIEIVAPGYETLVFNVRIIAGRKLDYRADLYPLRP
jgi:hypothetical protein